MNAQDMLNTLDEWAEAGWLRRLDVALARFLAELDGEAKPTVWMATAVLAQMEGRGHTCLALADLVSAPADLLAWPQAGQDAVSACWPQLPRTLSTWLDQLKASRVVRVIERGDPEDGQPLVLAGTDASPRLYLRRYWLQECAVARHIAARSEAAQSVDESAARTWLDKLFPGPSDSTVQADGRVDWQKLACAVALRGRLSVITGGPGTGKTYTAARLLALLYAVDPAREQLRVALAAPTGSATQIARIWAEPITTRVVGRRCSQTCSTSVMISRVIPGLRLGFSRHDSVVIIVPCPSPSMAPPSRIRCGRMLRTPSNCAILPAVN